MSNQLLSSQMLGRMFQLMVLVGVGVLAVLIIAGAAKSGARDHFHILNNHQDYAPEQPIHFSHVIHAGELKMECQFCHTGAEQWRHATIPPLSTCMNCHGTDETYKVLGRGATSNFAANGRSARGKEDIKRMRQSVIDGTPINWVRVHDIPDFVYFPHSAHVSKGLKCQECHGQCEDYEVMKQFSDLSMGWCINCHRDYNSGVKKIEIGMDKDGKPVYTDHNDLHAPLHCSACHH